MRAIRLEISRRDYRVGDPIELHAYVGSGGWPKGAIPGCVRLRCVEVIEDPDGDRCNEIGLFFTEFVAVESDFPNLARFDAKWVLPMKASTGPSHPWYIGVVLNPPWNKGAWIVRCSNEFCVPHEFATRLSAFSRLWGMFPALLRRARKDEPVHEWKVEVSGRIPPPDRR